MHIPAAMGTCGGGDVNGCRTEVLAKFVRNEKSWSTGYQFVCAAFPCSRLPGLEVSQGFVALIPDVPRSSLLRDQHMPASPATWAMGYVIGPAAGGLLAEPAVHYPHLFSQTGLCGR